MTSQPGTPSSRVQSGAQGQQHSRLGGALCLPCSWGRGVLSFSDVLIGETLSLCFLLSWAARGGPSRCSAAVAAVSPESLPAGTGTGAGTVGKEGPGWGVGHTPNPTSERGLQAPPLTRSGLSLPHSMRGAGTATGLCRVRLGRSGPRRWSRDKIVERTYMCDLVASR